jgi:hypothetical protein
MALFIFHWTSPQAALAIMKTCSFANLFVSTEDPGADYYAC